MYCQCVTTTTMKGGGLMVASMLLISLVTADMCAPNYHEILTKCYRFYQKIKNLNEAEMICEKEGAKLASVLDRRELQALLDHTKHQYGGGEYWTAGSIVSGRWMWTSNGFTMDLSFFKNPPQALYFGKRCAVFDTRIDGFYDTGCISKRKFICEHSLPNNVLPEVDRVSVDRKCVECMAMCARQK